MSHNSRKIYVDTTTTPHTGITLTDINAVVGSVGGDIGGVITDGATRELINKWAKYKPYRANTPATTDNGRRSAHYGLAIQEFDSLGTPSSPTTFLGKLVAGQLEWEYLAPRGVNAQHGEWFRFLDYDGYINDAVCPVGEPVTSIYVTNGNAQIAWDHLDNLDPGNLTLDDIYIGNTPLSDYYLGVLLYKSGSNYRLVTSDNTLGTGDVQITISDFPQSDLGDWQAFPFFSSVYIAYNGQTGTGSYVSAGWSDEQIVLHFRSSASSLSFYAFGVWRDNTHTTIDIDWYAYNEVSTERTVEPTLVLMYADEGDPPSTGYLAAQVSLGQVSVPAASGGVPGEASGQTTITRPSQISYNDYVWWLGIAVQGFTTIYEQIEEPEQSELT